jgi:hypothetical protein
LVSDSRRTFWIAITAWSANVATSSRSRVENGRTSVRHMTNTPTGSPSRSMGTPKMLRKPNTCCASCHV